MPYGCERDTGQERGNGGMVARPRHPLKDLESLLRLVEEHGWTVLRGTGYYRCRCPCGEHQRSVHLTPSNSNYARNTRAWFERQNCWEEEI